MQVAPPKHRGTSTGLYGVTSRKVVLVTGYGLDDSDWIAGTANIFSLRLQIRIHLIFGLVVSVLV